MGIDKALVCEKNITLLSTITCCICQDIAYPPSITKCNHLFCTECITKWLQTTNSCPQDREVDPQPREDKTMLRVIESLEVVCHNHSRGCTEKGPLSEMQERHEKECLFEVVKCPNEGCTEKMERKALAEHEKNCLYKKAKCEYCQQECPVAEKESHQSQCPELPMKCPNECGSTFTRKDYEKHAKVCPLQLIECDLGCGEKLKRQDMKKHVSENVVEHLLSMHKFMCNTLEAINNKIEKLEQRLDNLDKDSEQKKQLFSRTHCLHAHSERLISVTPLQDGGYLSLSLSKLMIWDSTGTNAETIRDQYMSDAVELKDGSILVPMGSGILKRWGRDKNLLGVFKGHLAWVITAIQLRDGTIVSGALDKTIRLWNLDGTCLNAVTLDEYPRVICELSDERIACGTANGEVVIMNKQGVIDKIFKVTRNMKINALIQLHDSRLAVAYEDLTIRVLKLDGTCDIAFKHHDKVCGLVQSSDKKLVSCSHDRTIRLWDIENKVYYVIPSSHRFSCICELKDGRLVSGSEDGLLHIWKPNK